ncbi:serpin B6-like [Spea bombifrons]|uniref:serpin B6-like n=1 Tax=Spea bombifrons TaxID=233779 RepID=UPI0023495842|nr:serpin B6-like [Spea bombifrons]
MDICTANNQFAADVLRAVGNEIVADNVVLSSLSILTAIAMVHLGARENTAAQIEEVLHFSDFGNVHPKCKDLLNELNQNGRDYTLISMSKLFGEKTYQFLPSYLEATNVSYGAALEEVDFSNDPEGSRQHINEWVKRETKGKIEELLPKSSVTSNTALVVANTLYFLANWTKQFNERHTYKTPFKLVSNEEVMVDMMLIRNTFNMLYASNPGMSVIELPYGPSQDLSMIILLPDNNTALQQLDQQISYENLAKWTSRAQMKSRNVAVHLPRFRIEKEFSLRNIMSSLGMPDAFNPTLANFSGMTDHDNLYVSNIYHKTFLEVNEKGTEAASAAAPVMAMRSLFSDEFKANRPFHFLIKHNKTNCMLLYGKLYKP